jgi:hypothetical protein
MKNTALINQASAQIAALSLTALLLSGCTAFTAQPASTVSMNAAESECAGTIEPPYGLEQFSDPALLAKAVGQAEKGGLCEGKTFKVTQPLTVYRVWDSNKSWSQWGNWWSFSPPAGPRDAYRSKNEICPSWSNLDRVTQCRLEVGTVIVIGTGQSAQCSASDKNVLYPPSAETQVFVPNANGNGGERPVASCLADTSWP